MTVKEFVESIKIEKDVTLKLYFSDEQDTEVGQIIKKLIKSGASKDDIYQLVNAVLNENCYTLLLALDGEASLAGKQVMYKLYDEENNELTGSGEIESEAFEMFME